MHDCVAGTFQILHLVQTLTDILTGRRFASTSYMQRVCGLCAAYILRAHARSGQTWSHPYSSSVEHNTSDPIPYAYPAHSMTLFRVMLSPTLRASPDMPVRVGCPYGHPKMCACVPLVWCVLLPVANLQLSRDSDELD